MKMQTTTRRLVAVMLIITMMSCAVFAAHADNPAPPEKTTVTDPYGKNVELTWHYGKKLMYGTAYKKLPLVFEENPKYAYSEAVMFEGGNTSKDFQVTLKGYQGPKEVMSYTEFRVIWVDDCGNFLGWTCAVRENKGTVNINALSSNGDKKGAKGFILQVCLCGRPESGETAFPIVTGCPISPVIPDDDEVIYGKYKEVYSSIAGEGTFVKTNVLDELRNMQLNFVKRNVPFEEIESAVWQLHLPNRQCTIFFWGERAPQIADSDRQMYESLIERSIEILKQMDYEVDMNGFMPFGIDTVNVNQIVLWFGTEEQYVAEDLNIEVTLERAETEPATEPETEPVTEPETEPVTEPVTEPETEPATEPATEPVTEPETEPEPVVTNPNKGPGNNNGNGNTNPGGDNPNRGPGNNQGNGNTTPGANNPNKGPGNNQGKK